MRLVRFGEVGKEKPGVLLRYGTRIDLSAQYSDWDSSCLSESFAGLETYLAKRLHDLPRVAESVRWAAPIPRPGKLIGMGLNCSDHAAGVGMPIPTEPITFLNASNTVVGPYDDV
jgi:2-keto-4-pentenoate hydratase/2-oxohepta-3-ene-1,7-dioic acid hydratase in catechol pathway